MTKEEYQQELTDAITANGYWSKEVMDINNRCIDAIGYTLYTKWHNEVTAKMR